MGISGFGAVVYKDTFHFLCFVLCFCWLKATGLYLLVLIEGTALTVWGAIEYSFPFIAIPLFTIGLYSSLLKERVPLKYHRVFGCWEQ
ncbi:hypothetical protein [Alistipes shahii]|jgi:hypothetical protein|uniref:hypothetical protein n=1 Tax=Alistipes shahii TaxID=328814 RepID=UPI0018787221|nr:hypothetical protein [Alistipes shahii]